RAKLPLNDDAVQKANDQFYALHPELVNPDGTRIPLDPNDPAQAKLRTQWMDLYLKNGGLLEGDPGGRKSPAGPVQGCPPKHQGYLDVDVVDEDGNPLEGATVHVEPLGEKTSDSKGVAHYGCVDPGTYTATAEKEDYLPIPGPWQDTVEVVEDQTATAK